MGMINTNRRSQCAISTGLDFYGDKWTLLIIRDMIKGKSRFKEFEESDEGIPTNILSSRLKKLEEQGFIKKEPYQLKPKRFQYTLLDKGRDLIPIMQSMSKWSFKYGDDVKSPYQPFLK
ncbi:MAG: helix-turn-helix domain-containing protein [Emcibacteraceae bacterium]|nr:helix-turn-helix domain-containing protein [Emcibacteraceae bacterium]